MTRLKTLTNSQTQLVTTDNQNKNKKNLTGTNQNNSLTHQALARKSRTPSHPQSKLNLNPQQACTLSNINRNKSLLKQSLKSLNLQLKERKKRVLLYSRVAERILSQSAVVAERLSTKSLLKRNPKLPHTNPPSSNQPSYSNNQFNKTLMQTRKSLTKLWKK